ncbi:MAG: hypothetical protein AAF591_03605 [Verrucomicrobiota bacterium]
MRILERYFNSWWLPTLLFLVLLGCFTAAAIPHWAFLSFVSNGLFCLAGLAFLGIVASAVWNLIKKRWTKGIANLLLLFGCGAATYIAFGFLMFASMFGPSEDGFADNLKIPEGIEIAEPEPDSNGAMEVSGTQEFDELQHMVRKALSVPGNDELGFAPDMPSLRRAATDHTNLFDDYIEASPDWHVFKERGNRFAARRWTYGGEPRDELHGYISEFGGNAGFQTRCLICLDRRQWSRYSVQHVDEGNKPVKPEMSLGNNLHESRVMIECGEVWVEIFEQSDSSERRVTKATVAALEKEFSKFLMDPQAALVEARSRAKELASHLVDKDGQPFRLVTGMQPGIYVVVYSLNPGEPGSVYLKAFEVTEGTPLSVDRLRSKSETRMTWSTDPVEKFGAKAGFTIYEGDWGKPYAARFEVWFEPDSGKPGRKLAERIFKIEGWQR